MLKSQQYKPSSDITIAPNLNKSILIFDGLNAGSQALGCEHSMASLSYIVELKTSKSSQYDRNWKVRSDTGLRPVTSRIGQTLKSIPTKHLLAWMTEDRWKEMSRRV